MVLRLPPDVVTSIRASTIPSRFVATKWSLPMIPWKRRAWRNRARLRADLGIPDVEGRGEARVLGHDKSLGRSQGPARA
jgi:hypothetical protein